MVRRAKGGNRARRWLTLLAVMLVAAATITEPLHAPPGWLLPEQRTEARVLHWLNIHWLNATAIGAVAAMIAALTALIQLPDWWHDRRETERTASQQARERAVMLRKVRRKWITDVLESSLTHAATLTLSLQTRPDILHIPEVSTRSRESQHEPVPEQKPILKVFEDAGGSLLILGAPGAGKTTLLLQLARALIERAERDPSQAIPVVVNLESWAAHRQALDEWLLTELAESYRGVPPKTANHWVETGELVLLLDGMDEVEEHHRAACAAAINDYQRAHGLNGLVVCCRTKEIQRIAVKLELDDAVELQPLTDNQVSDFLDHLEATGTPLTTVRAELATDEALKGLLSSPLMLSVVALAYHGREPTALAQHGNVQERESMLWEAYVERMFKQRALPNRCHYTSDQAHAWLKRLALTLQKHGQSEFRLDRMTGHQWLPEMPKIIQEMEKVPPKYREHFEERGDPGGGNLRLQPIDLHLEMSKELGKPAGPAKAAMTTVALIRFHMLLYVTLIAVIGTGLAIGFIEGWAAGLISAVIAIPAGLLISFAFLMAGMNESVKLARLWSRDGGRPNEGIRYAARHATYTGLAAFLTYGGSAALGLGQAYSSALAAGFGLCIGLWFAFWLGMLFEGAICVQHYTLRWALARAGDAPWRYEPFLDAMAERLLLRRSGGSYQFIHRLLRDHLADNAVRNELTETTAASRTGNARARTTSGLRGAGS